MTRAIEGHERFLRGVSREIRNPLTAVLGFSEILSVNSAGMSPEEIAEVSATIVAEAHAISALVDDLLVTARADPWSLAIVNEAVSIDQTIRSIVRDDMVVKHHSADAVMAWGDPIRVRQVLRNLINHAHRHGGERAWIELSQSGSSVRVSVCDDGPGIPDEHIGTIFEPYAGAPRYAGERESVGLGLHVARLLARRMGGDVRHHREEPITRIELTLPRSAAGDRGREHSPAEQ